MLRARTFIGLALATAVVVGAVAMRANRDEPSTIPLAGEPLFPDLMSAVNDVSQINATSGGETFSIKFDEGRWMIEDKAGYPADEENVRRLLLGAAELKRIEPKTSNPELYSELGVEEPTSEEAASMQFEVLSKGGGALLNLTLGNQRPGKSDPNVDEYYVRTGDDRQVWLVEGKLPQARSAAEWLDTDVLSLDAARVREVKVTHKDGATVAVQKTEREQADFELVGLEEGEEIDGEWKINDLGRALTELLLEDVKRLEEVDFDAGGLQVELATFDGLRVSMQTTEKDEVTLARLQAAFDESLLDNESASANGASEETQDTAAEELDTADTKATDAGEAAQDGEQASDDGADTTLLTPDEVKKEVKQLTNRWGGWAYAVPSFRMDYLNKKREELVKAESEEVEAPAAPESSPLPAPEAPAPQQ